MPDRGREKASYQAMKNLGTLKKESRPVQVPNGRKERKRKILPSIAEPPAKN